MTARILRRGEPALGRYTEVVLARIHTDHQERILTDERRVFDLMNQSRVKAEFERKVVADMPQVVERRVYWIGSVRRWPQAMLNVKSLRKTFGKLVAVDEVSFTVGRGQLVGLLGPNGAGKTTTVSVVAGLVTPDKGEVLIDGARLEGDTDPKKRQIGLVPQDLALYDELSARANLRFFGALYNLSGAALDKAIKDAMGLVGLADRLNDPVKTYSGGMKRRLNLAASLLHDPDILLLDEPTVGVDPQSRNAIFENLELLKSRGKAILYTTHYMEEVERLADRIVVMDHGKVIADDTLEGLQSRVAVAGEKATLESVFLTLTGRSLRD